MRGPAEALGVTHRPCRGTILLFPGPLTSTLQRFSAAAHQKPKLYFCPLFAVLRPSFWGIFSRSSSLDQLFSAGGIFAPQGTFLATPRDIFGCWLEGTTGVKWPGARLLLSALRRAGQPRQQGIIPPKMSPMLMSSLDRGACPVGARMWPAFAYPPSPAPSTVSGTRHAENK